MSLEFPDWRLMNKGLESEELVLFEFTKHENSCVFLYLRAVETFAWR